MKHLELTSLHNPDNYKAILLNNGDFIEAGENQGFQCLPKKTELWQKLDDGRLLKIRGWTTSVVAFYK